MALLISTSNSSPSQSHLTGFTVVALVVGGAITGGKVPFLNICWLPFWRTQAKPYLVKTEIASQAETEGKSDIRHP